MADANGADGTDSDAGRVAVTCRPRNGSTGRERPATGIDDGRFPHSSGTRPLTVSRERIPPAMRGTHIRTSPARPTCWRTIRRLPTRSGVGRPVLRDRYQELIDNKSNANHD